MTVHKCPGCQLLVSNSSSVAAPGGPAAQECFEWFGELLAASYVDPNRRRIHQLVVDAYTTQHGGGTSAREVQALAVCLMTLYLFLERGVDPAEGPTLHKRMADGAFTFSFLTPPTFSDSDLTAAAVQADETDYAGAVTRWAETVWAAWSMHHSQIREWAHLVTNT